MGGVLCVFFYCALCVLALCERLCVQVVMCVRGDVLSVSRFLDLLLV